MFNAISHTSLHANHACQCALAIHKAIAQTSPRMHVRIGVHTAPVLVGNIGSGHAKTFNILGAGVEAAFLVARLNQHLGTSTLISRPTMEKANEHYVSRGVDNVEVVTGQSISRMPTGIQSIYCTRVPGASLTSMATSPITPPPSCTLQGGGI